MSDRLSVLVVDDEPHILSFLEENLQSDDFTVYTASSIAQGRSRLNAYRPHIVLLDVMLPDAEGFDLVPALHRSGAAVVLISSRDRRDYGGRVESSGAEGFLGKAELTGPALREVLR